MVRRYRGPIDRFDGGQGREVHEDTRKRRERGKGKIEAVIEGEHGRSFGRHVVGKELWEMEGLCRLPVAVDRMDGLLAGQAIRNGKWEMTEEDQDS